MCRIMETKFLLLLMIYTIPFSSLEKPDVKIELTESYDIVLEGFGVINTNNKSQEQQLLQAIFDICYYYNTCNESNTIPAEHQAVMSCCTPCDCKEDCFWRGTCCRDKTQKYMHQAMNAFAETCTVIPTFGKDILAEEYLLVSHCPFGFQGESRDKCFNPQQATIKDTVPVFSNRTNTHYKNINCARCNSDNESLSLWRSEIKCPKEYFLFAGFINSSPYTIDKILTENECIIKFIAPKTAKKCYLNDGLTCYRWHDGALCETFQNKTWQIEDMQKNVVCGKCLVPRLLFCPIQTLYAFNGIIDWNMFSENNVPIRVEEDEKYVCDARKKTYLKESNNCVELACPPIQMRLSQEPPVCINFIEYANKLCFELLISISANLNHSVIFGDSLTNIVKRYFTTYKTPINEINVFNITLSRKDATLHYSLAGSVNSYSDLEWYYGIVTGKIRDQKISTLITMKLDDAFMAYESIPINHFNFLKFRESKVNTCESIALTKLQFCPMVVLAPSEYTLDNEVVITADGKLFYSDEYIIRTTDYENSSYVQVCKEDFIKRKQDVLRFMNGQGVNSKSKPGGSIVIWVLGIAVVLVVRSTCEVLDGPTMP